MNYGGDMLAQPEMPGRGQGLDDVPGCKILDGANPQDICQGSVGDCWLLCAMPAMAEYDGLIERLFKPTPDVHNMPHAEFNKYHIELSELSTDTPLRSRLTSAFAANRMEVASSVVLQAALGSCGRATLKRPWLHIGRLGQNQRWHSHPCVEVAYELQASIHIPAQCGWSELSRCIQPQYATVGNSGQLASRWLSRT